MTTRQSRRAVSASCPTATAALVVYVWALLLTASPVSAAAPSAQHPALRFWFRNEHPASRETSEMDARVIVLADGLGSGNYHQLTPIAAGLLDVPGVAAVAATYLVEAHLGQGDFESARSAAEHLREVVPAMYAEELRRIGQREALRRRLVEDAEPTPSDGSNADAPESMLQIGRLHAALGNKAAALASWRKVIHDAPDTLSARRGVRQIASLVALDMTDLAALAQLDAIVEDSPGTESRATLSEIYCEAAQALGRKGPTPEAATALEEALRFSSPGPARAEITLSLAETLLQIGRYKDVHALVAGLVEEPGASLLEFRQRAEYLDALAYHSDGDVAEARAILERIVAAPGSHPCRDGAEKLLEYLRQTETK